MTEQLVAIGVDGARAGWIAARLWRDEASGEARTDLELVDDIAALAALRTSGDAVVAIDVPIGLADEGPRACDRQARQVLGPRGSSVFPAPARWMLEYAEDYAGLRAHVKAQRAAGIPLASLSAQGHGIVGKIKEVDDWLGVHPDADAWLFECHPEVSFMALAGGRPLSDAKKSASGMARRRNIIAAAFPDGPVQLDAAAKRWRRAQVQIDDLHDAYACLHSALAITTGTAREFGDGCHDAAGRPMRMVAAAFEQPAPSSRRADVSLRPTTPQDVDFVVAAERDPEARPFISNSTPEEHRALIDNPAYEHVLIEAAGEPAGFMILTVPDADEAVELWRLVVARRGGGIGQAALSLVVDHVFRDSDAYRFWLDVLPRNARAQRVYTVAGFTPEGILRQAWLGPSGREDLAIMSILRPEWESRNDGRRSLQQG